MNVVETRKRKYNNTGTECKNHCVSSIGRGGGHTTGAPINNNAPGCGSRPKEERKFSTFHPGVQLYQRFPP